MNRSVALALAFGLALAGCRSAPQETGGPVADSSVDALEPAPDLAASEASLKTGTWHWVGTNRPADRVEPDDPAKYTIAFQGDSTVHVKADCNSGSGSYFLIEGQRLQIGPVTSTLMGCPTGSYDTEFNRELGEVEGWSVSGDTLSFSLKLGQGTMRFVRRG
jgi:heat shock protein HslJ